MAYFIIITESYKYLFMCEGLYRQCILPLTGLPHIHIYTLFITVHLNLYILFLWQYRQHPPISYYCRHACSSWPHHWMVPHTLLPAIPIISSAEAGQSLPPPPLPQPPPLSPPPPLPRFQPDPPPQSMFANVGAAPRRNFTVHPDWRRVQRP